MAYDPEKARARRQAAAAGNLRGPELSGVNPDRAVGAIQQERRGGPPASGAMFVKPENMALTRDVSAIPEPLTRFAQDPSRAAAVADDLDGLTGLAASIKKIPVVGDLLSPGMESFHALHEAARAVERTKEGSLERQQALHAYDAAASALTWSPLTGVTNIIAGPASRSIAKTEFGQKSPLGERKTEYEAQQGWQDFLNMGLAFATPIPLARKNKTPGEGAPGPGVKAPPVEPTPPPMSPKGDAFDITPEGHVMSPKGGAAVFETQKEAALWAVKEGKGTSQIWEIENNPTGGGYVIKQRGVKDPFTEPPSPGVDPIVDPAYVHKAERSAQSLKEVEERLTSTKTFSRDPKLAAEYVETVAPDTVVAIPGEVLVDLFDKHFADNPNDFPFDPVAMSRAFRSGQPLEMSLAQYMEITAGKPWAEEFRNQVIVNDGVSVEQAKELGKPALDDTFGFEANAATQEFKVTPKDENILKQFEDAGIKGVMLPDGSLQIKTSGLPAMARGQGLGTKMYEELIKQAKGAKIVSDSEVSSDAARVYDALHRKGYKVKVNDYTETYAGPEDLFPVLRSESGGPVFEIETITPEGNIVDEDYIKDLADQGMGDFGGAYWQSQTGKEFPEPEDIDPEGFSLEEVAQLNKAKATTKAAAKRVVQEQFLGKLFKDPKSLNMTPTQYKLYSEKVEKSFQDLTERLWKRTLDRVKKQYTAEWKAAYNAHSMVAANQILDTPVMKLEHALRYSAKNESDELLRDNAFVAAGEPMTFYHASFSATIGTDKNPWKPINYPVISFGTDPIFPQKYKGMSSDPFELDPYSSSTPVVYIAHLKAKNPVDFRKPEHVQQVAEWYADKDMAELKKDPVTLAWVLRDKGLNPEAPASLEVYRNEKLAYYKSELKWGNWKFLENPTMWEALGFDGTYMKESPDSGHVNAAVAKGEQVFFKYVQRFEELNYRLDPALKAIYPGHMWDALPNSMFSKEKGLLPDDLADEFGFSSGEELLRELVKVERDRDGRPFRKFVTDTISAEARQRAINEVGDLLHPDKIYQDASELFTAPEITDILTTELKQLSDEVGMPIEASQVELDAQMMFGQLTVKKALKLRVFERAMGDTGRKTEVALLKGKFLEAFQAKQKQLLNHYQLIESHKLNRQWDRFVTNMKRWATHKTLPNTSQEYLDRIHQLLAVQGVPIRRDLDELARGLEGALETFVERGKDAGLDLVYYDLPQNTLPDELTVDDFQRLNEMLVSLAKNGRAVKKIIDGGRERDAAEVIQEAIDGAGGVPNKPIDRNAGDWVPPLQRAGRRLTQLAAEHRILESLFDYLDGGNVRGVHNRVLMDGATEAANTVDRLQREFYSPLVAKFEKDISKETKKLYRKVIDNEVLLDPRDGQPIKLRRGDLLAVLANMGTKSNQIKLAEGYGTTVEAITDLLNQHITKEEADFVQAIWDTFEAIFPLADKNARAMKGFGLSKVKPIPVELKVGTLKGGYYPVRYDEKFNTKPFTDKFNDPDNPTIKPFRVVTTPTGFEKERTGYTGPVLLSLDRVLREHMRDVFVRIGYGEYVQSARRFILNQKVKNLWVNKLGYQYYNLLMPWLEFQVFDVGMPLKDAVGGQAVLRKLRQNLTLTVMGASYTVGRSQVLGLIPAVSELGLAQVTDGVKSFIFNSVTGRLNKEIYDKSEEMKFRHWNLEQNVRDVHADLHALDITATDMQRFYKKWGDATMAYINFMDKWTVSGAVWLAAYKQARFGKNMPEKDAILFADKVVRKTQGTGRPKDLPAVQRPNNEGMRLFTFAYTWPGRYFNLQAEAIREFQQGNTKRGMEKAFWIFLMIPVISALVDGDRPELDEDPDEWFGWLLRKITFGNVGTTIWTRDASGYFDRKLSERYARPPMTLQGRVIEAVDRAVVGQSQAWFAAWTTMLGLMGWLPGGGQIGKTGQFLLDVQSGEQRPKNALDWYNGLTTGKVEKR